MAITPFSTDSPPITGDQIVVVYENLAKAREVRRELIDKGIVPDDIRVIDQGEITRAGLWDDIKSMFAPASPTPILPASIDPGHVMLTVDPPPTQRSVAFLVLELSNPIIIRAREGTGRFVVPAS